MNNAQVQSIESIQGFSEHLQTFRAALTKDLESLDLQLRALSQWITDDALSYWRQEQQSNARRLAEHLQQLSRCMSYVRKDEERPCTEEKKRVAKAKERAVLCEAKIRAAQSAAIHWESRVNKLMTKLQRCRDMAEADIQVAISHLRKQLESLETYTRIRSDGLRSDGLQSSSPAIGSASVSSDSTKASEESDDQLSPQEENP